MAGARFLDVQTCPRRGCPAHLALVGLKSELAFPYTSCQPWLVSPVYPRMCGCSQRVVQKVPQWGAADAEIKVPSGETKELKRSPFKA